MAFTKTGSFLTVATSRRLDSPADWQRIVAEFSDRITPQADVRLASKASDPGEVVAQITDPDKWVFVHTTIMASVDLEDGSEFLVKEASEKWINDNGDAWERTQLLKDFGTFRNAAVYVEHNQHPEHAKGKVFDVVARDMGDTVLIDVLFGVDKRHNDLVNNITAGILNAVSMGCSTAYTKCTACGNLAHTENDYCEHIRDRKRQLVSAQGRQRKVAELCFDNNFFDCSIVASPAFSGAVFRRLVAGNEALRRVMANMLCSKIEEDRADFACEIKKAASLVQAKKEENASEAPNMDRAGHHPLNATETRKHDYQEDYRDFSPLPLTNNVGRTKSIDAYNKANPTRPLEGTDYDAFDGVRIRSASLHRSHRCPSCHAVGTEFVRRAASLESGNSFDTVLCERCGAVDMTEQWKLAKAKEYVRESAEMLRACRVAAMIDDRNLRAKFLNAVAGQVAGISKAHVETVLTDTVRSLGIDIGDGSTTVGTCGGYDRIKSVASKFGFVTTADILAACGEDGSDVAAVKLAYSGFRIVPCSASTVKLDDLERRLASRLKGKWSKVRLSALSGDDVSDAAIANDRVFKVWAAMQENPIGGQIDFCDVCTGSLDGSGVCLECGTSKIGDCSQCGSKAIALASGMCGSCYHGDIDRRAQEDEDMRPFQPTASFEKWKNVLDEFDAPKTDDARRNAAAELARLIDSRRVNVRIEASRKVSRILQQHPGLTVEQATAVLWSDLCEFMPAHDAGAVVAKVVDVKTNDQFGLGRNVPEEDAKEPAVEPTVTRTMNAGT